MPTSIQFSATNLRKLPLEKLRDPAFSDEFIKALQRIGIKTVDELLFFTRDELMSTQGLGTGFVEAAIMVLSNHGSRLMPPDTRNGGRRARAESLYPNLEEAPASILLHHRFTPFTIAIVRDKAVRTLKELHDEQFRTIRELVSANPRKLKQMLQEHHIDWSIHHDGLTPIEGFMLSCREFGLPIRF